MEHLNQAFGDSPPEDTSLEEFLPDETGSAQFKISPRSTENSIDRHIRENSETNSGDIMGQCLDLASSLVERTERERQREASPAKENKSPDLYSKVSKYKEVVYGELNQVQGSFLNLGKTKNRPIYNNLKLNNKHGKLYWEVITAIKSLGPGTKAKICGAGQNEGISNELTASSLKSFSGFRPVTRTGARNTKEITLRGREINGFTFLSNANLKAKGIMENTMRRNSKKHVVVLYRNNNWQIG